MRGWIQQTIVLVLLELLSTAAHRCDRTPEGHVAPKIPADNRFQLKISGAPEKYVPGEGYTITLHGQRSHGQVTQKFTGFMLVVEAQNHMPLRVLSPRDVTVRPVGTFQLYGDTLTKFSPSCPNMVTHTSSMPKSEIQVRWTAPPPGSGCVIFRATVIEHRDVWYQDDGPLSKMLCEEVQESHDSQPEVMEHCCACDEAKYEVTFEGLWSRHTHPKDFPSNSWLTRFSDVIGASHSTDYRFWDYGGFSSDGLRQVAERGSTRMLESELKSQSQHIRTIIKARGISYPNVTGKTFAVFRVDKIHHLMSLVSMIDPSPDWIVGVSALELCLRNCSWIESKLLNLYPWDAGTDSGVTYISPDQQTFPREKIRRITSSFPNDPRSPFYDTSGAEMKPLARLYLTRQRLYEKTCEEEPVVTSECSLSEWSDWGPCSATCGPGQKHRQRHYLHRNQGQNCPRTKLTDKKPCNARHCRFSAQPTREPVDPHCEVSEWADWSRCIPIDHTCTRGSQKRYRQVRPRDNNRRKYCLKVPTEDERECRPSMSPSVCPKNSRGKVPYKDPLSSTCCAPTDKGERGEETEEPEGNNETDDYNETTDQEDGDGEGEGGGNDEGEGGGGGDGEGNGEGDGEDDGEGNGEEEGNDEGEGDGEEGGDDYDMPEEPTGRCAMTKWSEWSPCSVTCGVGVTRRVRQLLYPPEEDVEEPRAEYLRALRNDENDYGAPDETENENNGEGEQGPDEYADGPCSIYKIQEVATCNGTYLTCQFSSGDAREICSLPPHPGRCPGPFLTRWYYDPKLEDCAEFEWTGCRGNKNRFLTKEDCQSACQAYTATESDEQSTTEGVTPTDEEDLEVLGQTRDEMGEPVEGTERPVRNCKFSRWSPWSKCDAACNQQGYKVRTRYIEVHAKNGGRDCVGKTRKQRKCTRRCKFNEDNDNEEEGEDRGAEEERRRNEECEYSDWSDWTECTATCGYHAVRQRTRQVVSGNPTDCTDRIRKKICNVGPCPQ